MQRRLKTFIHDTDGAVTVDWVVLTAAVVGLGLIVLGPVAFSTENMAHDVSDYISSVEVGAE